MIAKRKKNMPKISSLSNNSGFIVAVLVTEIVLALYWIAVLGVISFVYHEYLINGIVFGLHYAGLIALCNIVEDNANVFSNEFNDMPFNVLRNKVVTLETTKTKKTESFDTDDSVLGIGGEENDGGGTNEDGYGEGTNDVVFKNGGYPLEYGIALFVALISDFFSLVDVILGGLNNENPDHDVVYVLLGILFSVAILLTGMSLLWVAYLYVSKWLLGKRRGGGKSRIKNGEGKRMIKIR